MNTKQNLEKQTTIELIFLAVGGTSIVLGSLLTLLGLFQMLKDVGMNLMGIIYSFPVTTIAVVLLGLSLIALSEVIKQIRLSNLQHYTQNSPHESSKK